MNILNEIKAASLEAIQKRKLTDFLSAYNQCFFWYSDTMLFDNLKQKLSRGQVNCVVATLAVALWKKEQFPNTSGPSYIVEAGPHVIIAPFLSQTETQDRFRLHRTGDGTHLGYDDTCFVEYTVTGKLHQIKGIRRRNVEGITFGSTIDLIQHFYHLYSSAKT